MTATAQVIDFGGSQFLRISNGVIGAGTVTGLTLNTGFRRLDLETRTQAQGPCRMALEATQNGGAGIECPVSLAGGRAMAWS